MAQAITPAIERSTKDRKIVLSRNLPTKARGFSS
jgi:hypothetical protein